MKEIKVKLIDKTTLELLEDAKIGDKIKLDKLDDIQLDLSQIEAKLKEGKDKEYQKFLEKELKNKEKQYELEIKTKEAEIISKGKEDIAKKESEIVELKTMLGNGLKTKELEVKSEYEEKISNLKTKEAEAISKNKDEIAKKEAEIIELKTKLENGLKTKELEVKSEYESKVADFKSQIKELEKNNQLILDNEKNKLILDFNKERENLNTQIMLQKQEIDMVKDFRLRQSTKMLGESLEQHCEITYNQIGRTAFPDAQFYKDNDAKSGSKGDYIYKEYDENGIVILSIMFEMKNEQDTTATKHKNKDFFKELDKDRKEKDCEYAVLVSMLEQDYELYNNITPVWDYENMYVIRPEHFITIIALLRIGCIKAHQYKIELEREKNTNIDIRSFETNLELAKNAFGRNYRLASEKFRTAIEEIDKSIDHLNKIKSNLLGSEDNLRLANNKLEDLSVKKLGKGNETIQKLIEESKPVKNKRKNNGS